MCSTETPGAGQDNRSTNANRSKHGRIASRDASLATCNSTAAPAATAGTSKRGAASRRRLPQRLRKPLVRPRCQVTAPARPDKPPTGLIITRYQGKAKLWCAVFPLLCAGPFREKCPKSAGFLLLLHPQPPGDDAIEAALQARRRMLQKRALRLLFRAPERPQATPPSPEPPGV